MLKLLNLPARAAAGFLALASTSATVSAMPVLTAALPSPVQQAGYHHRHHHHTVSPVRPYDAAPGYGHEGGPGPGYGDPGGASDFGGFANRTNGAPPDNEFDPERPYGGQSAITAPPGTDAYEEQANERRYFCEFSPSRC